LRQSLSEILNSILDEQGDALVKGHGEVGDFSGIDAGAGFAQ